MITLPTNMALLDWATQAVVDLGSFGVFGRLDDPDTWQDWAAQFLNSTTLGRNLPNPYYFTDWKDWAERFCGALQ